MSFVLPANLLLLFLVPLFIGFLIWREQKRRKSLRLIGDTDLLRSLYPQTIFTRRVWKSALWLVTIATLGVALARPVWGIDLDVVESVGVSVMFVLDVSRSMDAQDVLPSRLERAKLGLQEMFETLGGNELGLILFAGTAFVQFPLTTDSASAETFLAAATSDSISNQGTNIDAALRLALDSLDEATSAKKVIVLVTDGENQRDAPQSAVAEAVQRGVIIDTIGYGEAEGAPIPLRDHNGRITGYKSDQSGNLVLSSLDEALLKDIADRTGGIYQHAAPDGQEAKRLINHINHGEAATLNRDAESHDVERFEIFVALAVLALTIETLLPVTQKKAV
jgi:Ca-activated chloride channel homolog